MNPPLDDRSPAPIRRPRTARWLLGSAAFGAALMLGITGGPDGRSAFAAPGGTGPGGGLRITEVLVVLDADSLLITGEGFDVGPGPLTVTSALPATSRRTAR